MNWGKTLWQFMGAWGKNQGKPDCTNPFLLYKIKMFKIGRSYQQLTPWDEIMKKRNRCFLLFSFLIPGL